MRTTKHNYMDRPLHGHVECSSQRPILSLLGSRTNCHKSFGTDSIILIQVLWYAPWKWIKGVVHLEFDCLGNSQLEVSVTKAHSSKGYDFQSGITGPTERTNALTRTPTHACPTILNLNVCVRRTPDVRLTLVRIFHTMAVCRWIRSHDMRRTLYPVVMTAFFLP